MLQKWICWELIYMYFKEIFFAWQLLPYLEFLTKVIGFCHICLKYCILSLNETHMQYFNKMDKKLKSILLSPHLMQVYYFRSIGTYLKTYLKFPCETVKFYWKLLHAKTNLLLGAQKSQYTLGKISWLAALHYLHLIDVFFIQVILCCMYVDLVFSMYLLK